MKIATFNINNINKRLANLLDWLRTAKPEVVCLQELKAADSEFPKTAIEKAGYGAAWRGERSWNGVAILARGRESRHGPRRRRSPESGSSTSLPTGLKASPDADGGARAGHRGFAGLGPSAARPRMAETKVCD